MRLAVLLPTAALLAAVRPVTAPGGSQLILSFDEGGALRSRAELDPAEMHAHRFAVLDSGELLLLGSQSVVASARLALMPATGGTLRDVSPPREGRSSRVADASSWLSVGTLSFLEPLPNGDALLVQEGRPVYRITATGESVVAFGLGAPPREGTVLVDVKVSDQRLAAIYSLNDGKGTGRWMTVHDISSGLPVATYGPVEHTVMCFRHEGSEDRFKLLGAKDGRIMTFDAIP
jgi:hypothetical protein